jgi:hypothetical protein
MACDGGRLSQGQSVIIARPCMNTRFSDHPAILGNWAINWSFMVRPVMPSSGDRRRRYRAPHNRYERAYPPASAQACWPMDAGARRSRDGVGCGETWELGISALVGPGSPGAGVGGCARVAPYPGAPSNYAIFGAPVLAPCAGQVVQAVAGDVLAVGQQVGEVGNSGESSEPHLHIHAQRTGTGGELFSGVPRPMRLDGRCLVRNDRVDMRLRSGSASP